MLTQHRMEAFKNITLPRLQLRQIVKIQAHIRGYLARHKRFKTKVYEHMAAVQIIDGLVTTFLEDKMIPDLLIDILRKNEVYDNVGLHSSKEVAFLQTREDMLNRVLKKMLREQLMTAIDSLVHQFINKKKLGYKDETFMKDPFAGPIIDPITLLAQRMTDDILRKQIKQMLRYELNKVEKPDTIISHYYVEASFIPYFT
jgi:hypothetical protein